MKQATAHDILTRLQRRGVIGGIIPLSPTRFQVFFLTGVTEDNIPAIVEFGKAVARKLTEEELATANAGR